MLQGKIKIELSKCMFASEEGLIASDRFTNGIYRRIDDKTSERV